jgi:hypothetical protein
MRKLREDKNSLSPFKGRDYINLELALAEIEVINMRLRFVVMFLQLPQRYKQLCL